MADGLLNKASIILTPTGYKAGTLYNVAPVVEPYEDFDFTRASVASRVNSSGLVEMVGRTLGSELVTNGDFASDSDWTLGTGWSIADGKATSDGSQSSNSDLTQALTTEVGKQYKITYTISNYLGTGNIFVRLNSGNTTSTQSSDGTFTEYLNGEGGTQFILRADADFEGSIDNISVKEVIDTNNIPRISYDSNGENGHILLEPTSTNLITYSEDFSGYIKTGTTLTPNAITSPNGQNNATKIIADTTTLQHNAYTTFSNSGATSFSVFAKASEYDFAQLYGGGSTGNRFSVVVNLTNGTIDTYDNINTNQISIQSFSNDWYRIIVNGFDNTNTFVAIAPIKESGLSRDAGLDIDYTGDNTSGVYFFGLQVEALSYATSYIPTLTGSTETRATETATGAGSADLINSTEGVLYAEIAALDNDGTSRRISLSNGSISNRVSLEIDETANRIRVHINASLITYDASDLTSFNKIAVKYKVNDYALWLNGVEVATSSSSEQPSGINVLSFTNPTETQVFYGKVKALAVFNEALSDSELTQLTT